MTAGVYLVRAENGLVKIGSSGNVEKRLIGLRTGAPLAVALVRVIETDRYKDLERQLHRHFADLRRRGEWFELSDADVLAAGSQTPRTALTRPVADASAAALARLRWAKAKRADKICPFCGGSYRGVKEQVYCTPAHQQAAATRRLREKRQSQPAL